MWTCARTFPARHESFAVTHLEALGFPTLLPMIKTARGLAPMFVNYVFVAIAEGAQPWQIIGRTPGVAYVLRNGGKPATAPEDEIEALRSRMDPTGLVRLAPAPSKRSLAIPRGARIRVNGAFYGIDAIYLDMPAGDRELVLMNILGAERTVAVDPALIAARA
jgi:transcription antitermination factor NusG